MIERSLVLLKPDAVQRGIVGEILHRFERMGLKVVASKFIKIDKEFGSKHYNHDIEWKKKVGERNKQDCIAYGLNVIDIYGTDKDEEIGQIVDEWNAEFLALGPLFAFVLEGPNAVQRIRDHVGKTFSTISPPGTIRGDYGLDSAYSGMSRKRTAYNMIHASGSVDEAKEEINLWFKPEEIFSYRRVHEDLYKY